MVNSAQTSVDHGSTNVIALKGAILTIRASAHEGKENVMPQFGSPFSELANSRKLTDGELIRAIRFMVAAEYEATQMYVQLAESTDNKFAVAVLKDIADEELVHAGEFLKLLYALAPDEEALYAKGAGEVAEIQKSQLQQKA
jgi:Mn-containing catalase